MIQNYKTWLQEAEALNTEKDWNFKKFKIQCNKCGSFNVEINGKAESESGWYGEHNINFHMLVKCHDCGQALCIKEPTDYEIEFKTINE